MEEIRIVDTTLRDGNTSLWAHNMTTGMMHPVLPHMDQAGFDAMEFFVSGRFKKVVREQRDNPWDWGATATRKSKTQDCATTAGSGAGLGWPSAAFRGWVFSGGFTSASRWRRLPDPG